MKRLILLFVFAYLWFCPQTGSIAMTLAGQTNSDDKAGHEVVFWQSVEDSNDIAMFRAYLKNFPNGTFADLAKIKISVLEKEIVFWDSVKDSDNADMLRAYLKRYPNGTFADQAKFKINALGTAAPNRSSGISAPGSETASSASKQNSRPRLRSTPTRLEEDEIRKMVKKHNFCDWYRNYDADFKNDFKDNDDGTLTDRATGLVWQKSGSWRRINRKKADKYIEELNRTKFAGRSNWRIPTVEELASLIENKPSGKYGYYIHAMFDQSENGNWLDRCWTADTLKPIYGSDVSVWLVDFKNCGIVTAHWYEHHIGSMFPVNDQNYIRAVSSVQP